MELASKDIMATDYKRLRRWNAYLEMLSVERVEPFVYELGLPVGQGQYSNVMHFARACLEVFMYPSLFIPTERHHRWEFPKYWGLYRKSHGTLSDESLQNLAQPFKHMDEKEWYRYVANDLYTTLQQSIGFPVVRGLREWFAMNYLAIDSGFELWYLVIMRTLKDHSEGTMPGNHPPVSVVQWRSIKEFTNCFEATRAMIRKRIEEIEESAKSVSPSPWEAVLQTFPADGIPGNDYPWLRHSIQKSLILQLFRKEWQRLSNDLGQDVIEGFKDWIRKESREDLPNISAIIG